MADISEDIQTAALKPKRVSGDEGSVEAHSLPDQIAADKYAASKAAASKRNLGIRFKKMTPPGAV